MFVNCVPVLACLLVVKFTLGCGGCLHLLISMYNKRVRLLSTELLVTSLWCAPVGTRDCINTAVTIICVNVYSVFRNPCALHYAVGLCHGDSVCAVRGTNQILNSPCCIVAWSFVATLLFLLFPHIVVVTFADYVFNMAVTCCAHRWWIGK